MTVHPLDRPVWNALTGRQAGLAIGTAAAWRIDPAYGPFAAARPDGAHALVSLLSDDDDAIWLIEPQPWDAPAGTRVVRTVSLVQMIADGAVPGFTPDPDVVLLEYADAPEMAALAHANAPGPWGPATHRYGTFYGIKDHGRLVAMAGERLRPDVGLGEVSGVCTDADYRGQGFALRLIRTVMAGLLARGDTPFLHSYAGNTAAIRLYESLGFRERAQLSVTILAKA